MNPSPDRVKAVLPLFLALALACASGARESAEPGVPPAASTSRPVPLPYTEADVRFMQGMIHHHAQALVMTDLVATHAASDDIRRLSGRIEVSQQDEIAYMRRWLTARDESVPEGHQHGPLMPGMLTEEELARLAGATGAEFDRLFLELMIRHHEGALVMVAELNATPGAGREPQIFQFASDVDADQRAEIARMRGMLNQLPQGGTE